MSNQLRNDVIAWLQLRWSRAKEADQQQALAVLVSAYDRFHAEALADHHFDGELVHGSPAAQEARFGELLLAMLLWQRGFQLSSAGTGPDFRATKDGFSACLELITPEPIGIPENYLRWPREDGAHAQRVPHEERLLRWTHALKTKSDKWVGTEGHAGWLQKGVVSHDEPYVVVINSILLDHWGWEIDGVSRIPYPAEVCFGVGPYAVGIDPATGQMVTEGNQYRAQIDRGDRPGIPTNVFLAPGHDHISAVLGCVLTDNRIPFGVSPVTELVHNPRANVGTPPIP